MGAFEARIVELDGEIGPVVGRGTAPAGPDLGSSHEDPVRGGVVVVAVVLRDDADAAGLKREGDDLAGEFTVGGFPEGSDGGHVMSILLLFGAAPAASSMAIEGPVTSGDAAEGPKRERRTAGGGFVVPRGMPACRQGKKAAFRLLRGEPGEASAGQRPDQAGRGRGRCCPDGDDKGGHGADFRDVGNRRRCGRWYGDDHFRLQARPVCASSGHEHDITWAG